MDELGIQQFCDCADKAGIDFNSVRLRVLQIQKLIFQMSETHTELEIIHVKKAIISAISDMSFGLERFAGRSSAAISGANYILSAVLPRMASLRDLAAELLSLTSSLFVYFNPDEENTLIKVINASFDEFYTHVKDKYVHDHWKSVRDIIAQKKYFMAAFDSASVTDAEISVICQVVPSYVKLPVIRVLEIRISNLFSEAKWKYIDVLPLLMYLKLYCQLTAMKVVLLCNAFDIFHHNSGSMNLAGSYLAAILEHIRSLKSLFSPLCESKHYMVLANIGPMKWPDIYAFLPLINMKCTICADWVKNEPVYPFGAVLAGRMANGSETFIGRIETETGIMIGQIFGNQFKWIGNLDQYIVAERNGIERASKQSAKGEQNEKTSDHPFEGQKRESAHSLFNEGKKRESARSLFNEGKKRDSAHSLFNEGKKRESAHSLFNEGKKRETENSPHEGLKSESSRTKGQIRELDSSPNEQIVAEKKMTSNKSEDKNEINSKGDDNDLIDTKEASESDENKKVEDEKEEDFSKEKSKIKSKTEKGNFKREDEVNEKKNKKKKRKDEAEEKREEPKVSDDTNIEDGDLKREDHEEKRSETKEIDARDEEGELGGINDQENEDGLKELDEGEMKQNKEEIQNEEKEKEEEDKEEEDLKDNSENFEVDDNDKSSENKDKNAEKEEDNLYLSNLDEQVVEHFENFPCEWKETRNPNDYQILCVTDPRIKPTWRPNVTGVPEGVGALVAGRDTEGAPYFIGMAFFYEEPLIGAVKGPHFYYEESGKIKHESDEMKYEILCLEYL